MTDLHHAFAFAAAVAGALTIALALLGALRPSGSRRWLDRAILVTLAALVAASVTGLPALLSGRLGDPLHVLYAAAAPGFLVLARFAGRLDRRRRSLVVVAAGFLLLGLLLRLAQTG